MPVTAVFLREDARLDRYELVLTQSGALQIVRIRSGAATVLARAANGIERLRVQDGAPERVGDFSLNADGFDWMSVWRRLRVLDPCVAAGTCR